MGVGTSGPGQERDTGHEQEKRTTELWRGWLSWPLARSGCVLAPRVAFRPSQIQRALSAIQIACLSYSQQQPHLLTLCVVSTHAANVVAWSPPVFLFCFQQIGAKQERIGEEREVTQPPRHSSWRWVCLQLPGIPLPDILPRAWWAVQASGPRISTQMPGADRCCQTVKGGVNVGQCGAHRWAIVASAGPSQTLRPSFPNRSAIRRSRCPVGPA